MQFSLLRLTLALLLGLAFSGVAQAQDTFDFIHRSGANLRGTILELGNTEVRINTGTRDQRVPITEISKVTFASEPTELRAARDQIAVGQYQDALDQLQRVDPDSLSREAIQRDYQFYLAAATAKLALSGRGEPDEALVLVRNFYNDVKDSGNHHYYEALELYGDLFVLTGDFNRAAQAYSMLEGGWEELTLHSKTLQARVLQLGGNFQNAANMYGEVIEAAPSGEAGDKQKSLALVGQAACLAEMGQEDTAIEQVEDVIQSNSADQSNVELFARAYNALGAAYQKQGKTQEALLAYLHVDLLFNGNPDAHAEALYNLSPLWNEVRMNDRSVRARELLRQRYSTSTWANRD